MNTRDYIIFNLSKKIGNFLSYIVPHKIFVYTTKILNWINTGYIRKDFLHLGVNSLICRYCLLNGTDRIYISDNVSIGEHSVLQAWAEDGESPPLLYIGRNTDIGQYAHITAVSKISIGDNVVTGRRVTITDNSHGDFIFEHLNQHPFKRPIVSKGPVVIEDFVWIGQNVVILAGCTIGKGAIIAAGAVVTKSIPPYSVAAGVPAKIIKKLKSINVVNDNNNSSNL